MKMLLVAIICFYHSILRSIGKAFALLTAGLFVGFMQGISDVRDMYKYLAYRSLHAQQQKRKRNDDEQNGDNDT